MNLVESLSSKKWRNPPYDDSGNPIYGQDQDPNIYILEKGEKNSYHLYEGPYRVIQTRVGYQNLERAPYCQNLGKLPILSQRGFG
jgi:hypothetical protein